MASGDKREGAGRPPGPKNLKKIPVCYKLPSWLVEWIRKQDKPAAQIIEDAVKRRHRLKTPEPEV